MPPVAHASIQMPARPAANGSGSLSPLAKSPPNSSTLEYASSAPLAASSSKHAQDGTEDEAIPDHLYSKLPKHYLEASPRGDVPNYLRMILMCTLCVGKLTPSKGVCRAFEP